MYSKPLRHLILKCFTEIEFFFSFFPLMPGQEVREREKREVKQPPLISRSISMFSHCTVLFFFLLLLSNSVKMVKVPFTRSFALVAINLTILHTHSWVIKSLAREQEFI